MNPEDAQSLQAKLDAAERENARLAAAIRAMWPVFGLAMAWTEHHRASELNALRETAGEAREGKISGELSTILEVVSHD